MDSIARARSRHWEALRAVCSWVLKRNGRCFTCELIADPREEQMAGADVVLRFLCDQPTPVRLRLLQF